MLVDRHLVNQEILHVLVIVGAIQARYHREIQVLKFHLVNQEILHVLNHLHVSQIRSAQAEVELKVKMSHLIANKETSLVAVQRQFHFHRKLIAAMVLTIMVTAN